MFDGDDDSTNLLYKMQQMPTNDTPIIIAPAIFESKLALDFSFPVPLLPLELVFFFPILFLSGRSLSQILIGC